MTYIFGPILSRRLGRSLGVDLTPPKTCTYDCLYCQVGKTTRKEVEPSLCVPLPEVLRELKERLEEVNPDYVTLSGSGEPTLFSGIGEVISGIKSHTGTKVALLTNGSLLWREDVRRSICGADLIMPTLSSAFEKTYRAIHRPHHRIRLPRVLEGIRRLRREFRGELFLELMFLRGFNDSDAEVEALKGVVETISPDRVQLNTVVRPPADRRAQPLDRQRTEEIKTLLGPKTEVIVDARQGEETPSANFPGNAILEMARRRPVRLKDLLGTLDLPPGEVEFLVKGLLSKGVLQSDEHHGETYYYCRTEFRTV